MRIVARLAGRDHEIDVSRDAADGYQVTLDGRRVDLDVTEPEPGVFSLRIGDGSYEAVVRRDGSCWTVSVDGRSYPVEVRDPSSGARDQEAASLGRQVVTSVMPGKVVDVMVTAGQRVDAGHPLVIIEAMKMENEIRSPKDGVVRSVAVKPGQAVEAGAHLVVVE